MIFLYKPMKRLIIQCHFNLFLILLVVVLLHDQQAF
jgi:hypothetical protein